MKSRTAIQGLYESQFKERISDHGDNVKSLWNIETSQRDWYKVLMEVGDLTGYSIPDVGCSFGDLVAFMLENKVPFTRYIEI